ncbi:uncharacterized protein PG998_007749 [Apiospora kogelbergensis]|uniref:uncharacterized protein n=1 Tax=Apiospora kogelbergensis TaxID=1337665 RepID=UPI00312CE47E
MKTSPITVAILTHAVRGLASPTAPIDTGQAATAAAAEAVRENGQSSTASHVVEYGTAAGTTSQGENRFLGLIQGWQHRRASGYYLLTDACGDVITEYQEARHVRLAGCNVTDCTVELLDREADDIMISKKMTSSSSSSTWCNVPVTQSADPITSLMGHLRCLASPEMKMKMKTQRQRLSSDIALGGFEPEIWSELRR